MPPAMPPTTGDQNIGGRQYICPMDQYFMALDPNHQPRSEEVLLRAVRARAPKSDVETAWKLYTAAANRVVEQLKSKPAVAVRGTIPNDKVSTQQSSYYRKNPKLMIRLSSTTIFRTASMSYAYGTAACSSMASTALTSTIGPKVPLSIFPTTTKFVMLPRLELL